MIVVKRRMMSWVRLGTAAIVSVKRFLYYVVDQSEIQEPPILPVPLLTASKRPTLCQPVFAATETAEPNYELPRLVQVRVAR
jgi:hypothetical protein